MNERSYRRAAAVSALLTLALVPVGRAWFEGRSALLAADRSLRAGDEREALNHAREAAGWWLPGSPFSEGAFARLRHVGHTAEAGGDLPTALVAWRALRASVARVRWPTAQLEAHASHARAALARVEPRDAMRSSGTSSSPPSPSSPSSLLQAGGRGDEFGAGPKGAALATLGGLGAFATGAGACVRRGGGALAARWPLVLAGLGLALAGLGLGSG
ncbi:MAG: hypothetical protein MUF34_02360 [Polyangiaceae bacterium]|nr:hypothetical protein [Polyangiaceae bacterium]